MFQYSELTSERDLEAWSDDWRELHDRTPHASIFRSFEWYKSVLDSSRGTLRPHAIAVSMIGKPTGILPLVEVVKNSGGISAWRQRKVLRLVPGLWSSPAMPVGPNLAATLSAAVKYLLAAGAKFSLGPVDTQYLDHGRTANAFRLANRSPLRQAATSRFLIDLESVSNSHSRLRQQLSRYDQLLARSELPTATLHRYRSGEDLAKFLHVVRLIDRHWPANWTVATRTRLVQLMNLLESYRQLDASVLRVGEEVAAVFVAQRTDNGIDGGVFRASSDAPDAELMLLAELVRDGLLRGDQVYRISDLNEKLVSSWASQRVSMVEYSVAANPLEWACRKLISLSGSELSDDPQRPVLENMTLTSRTSIPVEAPLVSSLREDADARLVPRPHMAVPHLRIYRP